MKTLFKMKRHLMGILFMVFAVHVAAQQPAQSPSSPSEFPRYIDTGNPSVDNSVFEAAKTEWYATHPEDAARLGGAITITSESGEVLNLGPIAVPVEGLSRDEAKAMPAGYVKMVSGEQISITVSGTPTPLGTESQLTPSDQK